MVGWGGGGEGRDWTSHPPALDLTEAVAPSQSSPVPLPHRQPPRKSSLAY